MNHKLLLFYFLLMTFATAYSQNIGLYEQFNGRYDFTFTGNTLNTQENNGASECTINTFSSAALNLNTGDAVQRAYLYWAGSGTGDFDVKLNGQDITAQRNFPLTAVNTDGGTRQYFSAFADVTTLVQAAGNGNYTLSDLDLTNVIVTDPYCGIKTNFGGWVIVIFYTNPNLPINQLNLYDGLQYVPTAINISLPSINVVDNIGAKIGFVAWEGDSLLDNQETLSVNGSILSNDLNPPTNAFNSTNSITGSNQLYNMDLDVYDIQDLITIGDQTAEIQLTSGADFVMINAIITKLNSQLPDATVQVDDILQTCNSRTIKVDYTVYNVNSTLALPADTPVAIYIDGVYFDFFKTTAIIPVGGSESGTITLEIPADVPLTFQLLLNADDIGNGTGVVTETNEANNSFVMNVTLWTSPPLVAPPDVTACNPGNGFGTFDFSGYEESLKNSPTDTVTFYLTQVAADAGGNNNITNPEAFTATSNQQQIFVRLEDENGCFTVKSFRLLTVICPDATITINNIIQECNSRIITLNYTVFNTNGDAALPTGTPLSFYADDVFITSVPTAVAVPAGGSINGTITLTIPQGIPVAFNLFAVVDDNGNGTGIVLEKDENNNTAILQVTLWLSPPLQQPDDITVCETDNNTNIGIFNFSGYLQSLKNEPDDVVTFHTNAQDAEVGTNAITNPGAYTSDANPDEIFVRLENKYGCFSVSSFSLIAVDCLFPDGTVVLGEVVKSCDSRLITVAYSINNFNSFDVLPSGTPVAIYANGEFLNYTETLLDIPIDGSEAGTINLTIPNYVPADFQLTFVVDDTGDGTGIVIETDENNNGAAVNIILLTSPVLVKPATVVSCNEGSGFATFDFSGYEEQLKNNTTDIVTFYKTQDNTVNDTDRIYNTSSFNNDTNPQTIYVRLDNGVCFTTGEFMLLARKCPPTTYNYVTPNGDGVNDTFFIKGLRNIFFNFKLSIYNRWGNLVWTGDHSKADWDGIASEDKVGSEGTTLPAGTYYFVLELNDPDYPEPIVDWVYVTR